MIPQAAIAISSVAITSSQVPTPRFEAVSPKTDATSVAEIMPPSMKTSPWAKLISSRIP